MSTALTFEDCQSLCARGLMSTQEAMECLSCTSDGYAMEQVHLSEQSHMGLLSQWQTGNNPLTTSSPTGRDPPVPGVAGSGVEQVPSQMSLSGRDPSWATTGWGVSSPSGCVAAVVGVLGFFGLYVAAKAATSRRKSQ